jgi:hypothetical protein
VSDREKALLTHIGIDLVPQTNLLKSMNELS